MTAKGVGKTESKNESLYVRAFGGLTIYYNNQPITLAWESQKARILFCSLLVTYDQWVHRDKLIEFLWPGCVGTAGANNFKTTLSRLRKSFQGSRTLNPVITQGEAVRIDPAVITLDVSRFRHCATNGIKLLARGDVKSAKKFLESAQDLYIAEFLPEEPLNPFLSAARIEFAELHDSVLKSLEKIYQQEGNEDALEVIFSLRRSSLTQFA